MSAANETFFTSIGCMDGRVQSPIQSFGRESFGVLFGDTITEAGLVGLLANNPDAALIDSLTTKIMISLDKHASKGIIVHGHAECAGNPVSDDLHINHVRQSVARVRELTHNRVPVIGVFVSHEGGEWIAKKIEDSVLV